MPGCASGLCSSRNVLSWSLNARPFAITRTFAFLAGWGQAARSCSAPGWDVGRGEGASRGPGLSPGFWLVEELSMEQRRSLASLLSAPGPFSTVRACRAAQEGCRVSFSGDIRDPPGQGPVQPAVGDPASTGGLDWVTHRGPCQPLPFCDSVIL